MNIKKLTLPRKLDFIDGSNNRGDIVTLFEEDFNYTQSENGSIRLYAEAAGHGSVAFDIYIQDQTPEGIYVLDVSTVGGDGEDVDTWNLTMTEDTVSNIVLELDEDEDEDEDDY